MIQEFHFPDRRENSGKWLDNEQKYCYCSMAVVREPCILTNKS